MRLCTVSRFPPICTTKRDHTTQHCALLCPTSDTHTQHSYTYHLNHMIQQHNTQYISALLCPIFDTHTQPFLQDGTHICTTTHPKETIPHSVYDTKHPATGTWCCSQRTGDTYFISKESTFVFVLVFLSVFERSTTADKGQEEI